MACMYHIWIGWKFENSDPCKTVIFQSKIQSSLGFMFVHVPFRKLINRNGNVIYLMGSQLDRDLNSDYMP